MSFESFRCHWRNFLLAFAAGATVYAVSFQPQGLWQRVLKIQPFLVSQRVRGVLDLPEAVRYMEGAADVTGSIVLCDERGNDMKHRYEPCFLALFAQATNTKNRLKGTKAALAFRYGPVSPAGGTGPESHTCSILGMHSPEYHALHRGTTLKHGGTPFWASVLKWCPPLRREKVCAVMPPTLFLKAGMSHQLMLSR